MKFNKGANNSKIKLIKGFKKSDLNIVEYISNRKNLRIKPIDSSLNCKQNKSSVHAVLNYLLD